MDILKHDCLKVFEIIDHIDFNDKNFMKFTGIITNVENVKTIQLFFIKLNEFYEEYENKEKKLKFPKVDFSIKNIKKFFSYFTILYCPDIMNLDPNSITAKNLKSRGAIMRIHFLVVMNYIKNNEEIDNEKLLSRIKDFLFSFQDYDTRFDEWKNMDRECLIYNLTQSWCELDKDISYSEKENSKELHDITKEHICIEKKKIIEKILLLDKDDGDDKFKNYFKIIEEKEAYELKQEEFIENLSIELERNMKKSFWDLMKQDLNKDPPVFISFINNLKELKNIIVACVIKNKSEIRNELDKVIDIELIEQMLKYKAYIYKDLVNIIRCINSYLWEFQAPSEDEKTKKYEDKLNKMIERGEDIVEVLIYFMAYTMEKFENILLIKYQILKN